MPTLIPKVFGSAALAISGTIECRPPIGEYWVLASGNCHNATNGNVGTTDIYDPVNGYKPIASINPTVLAGERGLFIPLDNTIRAQVNNSTGQVSTAVITALALPAGSAVLKPVTTGAMAPSATVEFRPPAGKTWVVKSMWAYNGAFEWRATNGTTTSGLLSLTKNVAGSSDWAMTDFTLSNSFWLNVKNNSGSGTGGLSAYLGAVELDSTVLGSYGLVVTAASGSTTDVRPPVSETWMVGLLHYSAFPTIYQMVGGTVQTVAPIADAVANIPIDNTNFLRLLPGASPQTFAVAASITT